MPSRSLKNRTGTKKRHPSTGVLAVLCIVFYLAVSGLLGVRALVNSWLEDLPDYQDASAYNVAQPTVIYASDRTTVLAEFQLENRDPVELDEISMYVFKATVAVEDERFYEHGGVDLWGIARAATNNLMGGSLEGASTITQQFARNTILADEADEISLRRKVREAFVSLKLEEMFSKDDILLMYLNTINYGSGAYGIQAASQRYFSKDATQLSLAEAAALAGIPQSPTYNNPIDYPENCLDRRNLVLGRMLENGFISQEEHDEARAQPLVLDVSDPSQEGIRMYPYFTSYMRNRLTDPEGAYAYSNAEILKGGLTVYTTLDVEMQEAAEVVAANKEAQAGDAFEVALVAVDPGNGHVRALVGGRDYSASQVNLATGEGGSGRQAGSAFKTFTLVAALEAGISPDTLVDCSATASLDGWNVANIDYLDYGVRSVAGAYEVSSNTGFARLIMSLGPGTVAEVAHRMGVESELKEVGSLTLGDSSVTPLEMAASYAVLANGGTRYEPECIEQVVSRSGEVLVDNAAPVGRQALAPEVAHAAVDVMKRVVESGTGTDARLEGGREAAGKTGTSEDYKDSWFCGITPQLSVAVWLGDRSDYVDAESVPPSVTAASAFADFANAALEGQPLEEFPQAGDPPYEPYSDPEYHIGPGYWSY